MCEVGLLSHKILHMPSSLSQDPRLPGDHCSHLQLRTHRRSLGGPTEKGETGLVLQAPCQAPTLPPGLGAGYHPVRVQQTPQPV